MINNKQIINERVKQRATYIGHKDLVGYCRWIDAKLGQKLNVQAAPGKIHGSTHASAHHIAGHVHDSQSSTHHVLNATT